MRPRLELGYFKTCLLVEKWRLIWQQTQPVCMELKLPSVTTIQAERVDRVIVSRIGCVNVLSHCE